MEQVVDLGKWEQGFDAKTCVREDYVPAMHRVPDTRAHPDNQKKMPFCPQSIGKWLLCSNLLAVTTIRVLNKVTI